MRARPGALPGEHVPPEGRSQPAIPGKAWPGRRQRWRGPVPDGDATAPAPPRARRLPPGRGGLGGKTPWKALPGHGGSKARRPRPLGEPGSQPCGVRASEARELTASGRRARSFPARSPRLAGCASDAPGFCLIHSRSGRAPSSSPFPLWRGGPFRMRGRRCTWGTWVKS